MFEGLDLRGNRWADPWLPNIQHAGREHVLRVEYGYAGHQKGCFASVQAAIDRVLSDNEADEARLGSTKILVGPGYFEGPIVVPRGSPPIEIVGAGKDHTTIAAAIDAQMTGQEYATRFRSVIQSSGPKSRAIFESIAARQMISTGNTAVLRVASSDVRISGITVRNSYCCDRSTAAPLGSEPDVEGRYASGQHQAVALMLDNADRVIVENCVLSSFQDTLYLKSDQGWASRSLFKDCEIEGDVDFIFGGGTVKFERCVVRSRGERGAKSWALAPSTSVFVPHGFVFAECEFQHDGHESGTNGRSFLGRQWFEGVRATPYGSPSLAAYETRLSDRNGFDGVSGTISRKTLLSVGKARFLNCVFGQHLNSTQFWDDWASGAWSPRYRPAQYTSEAFLTYLEPWLLANDPTLFEQIPTDTWLSID